MSKSKKELDRDSMFRKIIPALADNPFSIPVTDMGIEDEDSGSTFASPGREPDAEKISDCTLSPPIIELSTMNENQDYTPSPPTAEARIEEDWDPSHQVDELDDLSALRARLFARSDSIGGVEPVSTINLMENLVLKHLDEVIQRFNCCRCDRCRRDIAAFALTHLPPQYIVANSRHIEEIEQRIPKQVVYDALVKAVIRVRSRPRH